MAEGGLMEQPLAIDLFCGLGGWTEGLLAEGYRVVGFDIERHQYGDHAYPAQLVLQDVLTLHARQFKDAALIVASPPCQGYSYRAMPWKRAKALPPPDNGLFEACFRIQREASEAAGRHIPLVVENVRGAEKWVGRARWKFGSFYLWGDVPALMPLTKPHIKMGRAPMVNGVTRRRTNPAEWKEATKGVGIGSVSWGQGKGNRHPHDPRNFYSKSPGRKMASAMIAKIPLVLSRHIGKAWKPAEFENVDLSA